MSRRTEKNVGVIGLGIIGRRVADQLRRRGFHVFVWNRTPRPFPNFVGAPEEIAQLCDFIQIFVSDDEALLQMVQQMKQTLKPRHVVMAHSTVAPATMRAAAEMVQRRGAQLLDAPFTGSKLAAEKGEMVYYVAGDDAAFRRARPVLEASSKEIIEIGEIGQATTIKLATNMITAVTVQVTAEALALVHSTGVSVEKFATAMRGNASNSPTLAMKLPKMLEGDFDPHFSVKHMLKDVEIATRLARAYGLSLGATETARDSLATEVRRGHGDADYSSMVRAFFPEGAPVQNEVEEPEPEQSSLELEEPITQPAPEEEPAAAAAVAESATAETPAVEELPVKEEGGVAPAEEPPAVAEKVEGEASGGTTSDAAAKLKEEKPEPEPPSSGDEKMPVESNGDESTADRPAAETPSVEAKGEESTGSSEESPPSPEPAEAAPVKAGEGAPKDAGEEPRPEPAVAAAEKADADVREKSLREESPGEPPPKNEEAVLAAPSEAEGKPKEQEEEPRRGFFSRMFGGSGDY